MVQFDSIIIKACGNTTYDLLNLIKNFLTKHVFEMFTRKAF